MKKIWRNYEENMKKLKEYEEIWRKCEEIWKKYEGTMENMKKYEGIMKDI